MNKKTEFTKNTILLLLGKFCTQFITFFLLPIFTRYLLPDDYGYVDLMQSYISLFVPVLILRLDSAIFRFLIDARKDNKKASKLISTTSFIILTQILLLIFVYLILNIFVSFKYSILIVINIIVLMISNIILQIVRGLGNNKEYAISSIITGAFNLIINYILIVQFNFGAESILISNILANVICSIYLFIRLKMYNYIGIKNKDKKIAKDMLKYSLPMIPNGLSWWIVNVSDRSLITWFINEGANGIYSVSCKFSNLLNNVFSVFSMSWQESASLHIDDEDADSFFSEVIDKVFMIFCSVSLLIVAFLPLVYDIVIGFDYIDSYIYIPVLLLANLLNVYSNLIGAIYVAKKNTKEIAKTTILSAIINVVVNVAFIVKFKIWAAVISTLVSYLVITIYRYIDVKKYINIKFNFTRTLKFLISYIVICYIYYNKNILICIVGLLLSILFTIYINFDLILKTLKIIKSKFLKK